MFVVSLHTGFLAVFRFGTVSECEFDGYISVLLHIDILHVVFHAQRTGPELELVGVARHSRSQDHSIPAYGI